MGFITNKLNKHNWGGHIVPFGNQTQRANPPFMKDFRSFVNLHLSSVKLSCLTIWRVYTYDTYAYWGYNCGIE